MTGVSEHQSYTLLFLTGCFLLQITELYRFLAVGISLWNQFAVPALFSLFWCVLFTVQLCSDVLSAGASAVHSGIIFLLLTRCDFPLSPSLAQPRSASLLTDDVLLLCAVCQSAAPRPTLFWV